MSVIFENKDERGNSRRISAMGPLVCTGRVSRHMEEKHYERIGNRGDGVRDCGEIFNSFEEGIGEGSRIEEVGARRKNNGRVCTRIQEGSKR